MTSTFDPSAFEETVIEQEMETKFTPVPEGEYQAFIEELDFRMVNESPVIDVTYRIIDDELAAQLNLQQITVRQGIFLDADIVDGKLVMQQGANKNIRLGRLREACGQNTAGAWQFSMLKGAGPLKVMVTQNVDKNDPSVVYNNVSRVAAA